MKQVYIGRIGSLGMEANTRALCMFGEQGTLTHRFSDSGVELDVVPWPLAGTLRNFVVALDSNPGSGSWTFTLYKNAIATALTVTLTGTNRVVSDKTHN